MTDKQIKILEKYVLSKGKGVFEKVEVIIDDYGFIDIGIYVDWNFFPKNHGVYKLKDSFLNDLKKSVKTFIELLGVNVYKYYFIDIVIKNNFDESQDEQPINEIERDWRDKEYSEQYSKIGKKFVDFISKSVTSYREDDESISLYDENDKRLMSFYKSSGELFYNSDMSRFMTDVIPVFIWARHDKYIMSDVFEELFPDYTVRSVIPAGMN